MAWGPVIEGHGDIEGIPASLLNEFSKRSEQVEARLSELVTDWVDSHGGAEPDPRTLYRLERMAVLDSRPGKEPIGDADALRASWCRRAAELGVESLDLPAGQASLPGTAPVDRKAIIDQALARVAASSSTWLAADLAREIATLVPPESASSTGDLVALVDELAAGAAGRCVGLHRAAPAGTACRRDGRPLREHVVDRQLTTGAVWRQEARLLSWAETAVASTPSAPEHDQQVVVARAAAGDERLVLVVGPAGAGKTTALSQAARLLDDQGRPVLGLAPSGKAADVLGPRRAGRPPRWPSCCTSTPGPRDREQRGACRPERRSTLMKRRWPRLRTSTSWWRWCSGTDGGWYAWATRLNSRRWAGAACSPCGASAYRPTSWRRYDDSPRTGRRRPAWACAGATGRLPPLTPPIIGCRPSIPPWWPTGWPASTSAWPPAARPVAITASAGTARHINVEIQRRRNPRQDGPNVALADGTCAFVGDGVATRRNVALATDTGAGPQPPELDGDRHR